jgi:hypothetical protein
MNQVLSIPKLALVASKFQVGADPDPESTHMVLSANGSFSFQVNFADGA